MKCLGISYSWVVDRLQDKCRYFTSGLGSTPSLLVNFSLFSKAPPLFTMLFSLRPFHHTALSTSSCLCGHVFTRHPTTPTLPTPTKLFGGTLLIIVLYFCNQIINIQDMLKRSNIGELSQPFITRQKDIDLGAKRV